MTINIPNPAWRRLRRGTPSLVGLVLLALTIPGLLSERAFAPPTLGNQMYGTGSPSVRNDDLDLLQATLALDEFQQEIVSTFYAVYRDNFTEGVKSYREQSAAVVAEMRGKTGDDLDRFAGRKEELDQAWRRESQEIENQFFGEVRSLLTESQARLWPVFERDRRRQRLIGQRTSRYDGEHVDLVALVDDIKLPAGQRNAISSILDQYANFLDRDVLQRERAKQAMEEQRQRQRNAAGGGEDLERFERDLHEASLAICLTNERYAEQIISALDRPWNERYEEAWLRRAFRSIFNPTRATRYLERILGLHDLTEAQQVGIDQIHADYERQLAPLNRELMEVRRKQREEFQPMIFGAPRGQAGNDGWTNQGPLQKDPILSNSGRSHTDLWRARNDLDYEIMNRLQELLTEDQRQRVPKPFGGRSGERGDGNARKRLEQKSGDR